MQELGHIKGFSKTTLLYFHKHSLHMVFPFGNPQTLKSTKEVVTLQAIYYSGGTSFSILQAGN